MERFFIYGKERWVMIVGKAKLLLEVDNLQTAREFYIAQLGWKQVDMEATGQAVMLCATDASDYFVVMAESDTSRSQNQQKADIASWLLPEAHRPKRGDHVYVGVTSVQGVEQELRNRGVEKFRQEEDAGSVRKLFVPAPDGYTIVYWEELFPTDEEILTVYGTGADELEQVLRGLSEEEKDAAEAPGKWSIRQQVLHLIDLELVTIHKVKFALAEPGRMYQGNGFTQDDWCAGLDYARRPLETELAMFRAVREHILGLCRHLPNALERTIITPSREESVAKLLKMMSGHALHHIKAITRIRENFRRVEG
jgi:hypothetical protein